MNQARTTTLKRVVAAIREEALRLGHDTLLGSEDELVARFGVSRPTFRQAAKLLEQEQLLKIKRGVGGGYFVQRPTGEAVAHVTAVYLHSRSATLQHLILSAAPIYAATAAAAAASSDQAQLQRLREFAAAERASLDEAPPIQKYLKTEGEFGEIFYSLSGNPVLNLFLEIILNLSKLQSEGIWLGHAERIQHARRMRLRLAEAILESDVEATELAARRMNQAVRDWFEEDLAKSSGRGSQAGNVQVQSGR